MTEPVALLGSQLADSALLSVLELFVRPPKHRRIRAPLHPDNLEEFLARI